MSTTELAEVEALLERVLPGPVGSAQRLLQQVVTKWAEAAPAASGVPDACEPEVTVIHDPGSDETLTNITLLLESALDACDCWVLEPGCTVCHGKGSAGWSQPNGELFQEYVGPADDSGNLVGVSRVKWTPLTPNCRDDRRDQHSQQETTGDATFSAVIDGEVQTVNVKIK